MPLFLLLLELPDEDLVLDPVLDRLLLPLEMFEDLDPEEELERPKLLELDLFDCELIDRL